MITEALRTVAARPRSTAEVRTRLGARGHGEAEIDRAVAYLKAHRYLDDTAMVDRLRERARTEGRSPAWLHRELERRGLAAETPNDRTSRDDGAVAAIAALEKKVGGTWREVTRSPTMWQKAAGFLLRRGFAEATVTEVMGDPPEDVD